MIRTNKKAEELSVKIGYKRKYIYGIKNPNLKVKVINSYWWVVALLFAILYFEFDKRMIFLCLPIIIVMFLNKLYTIYFANENLVIKNGLGKHWIFDINQYPRIYAESYHRKASSNLIYTTIIEYHLYIQQYDIKIDINLKNCSAKSINKLISSLAIKEEEECSEREIKGSANREELNFINCKDFLDKQEKIIGVKEKYPIIIKNGGTEKRTVLICTIIAISSILGMLVFEKFGIKINDMFISFAAMMTVVTVFIFITYVDKGIESTLKISYPNENTIKINKYFLNYEQNDITLELREKNKRTNVGVFSKSLYALVIKGEENQAVITISSETMRNGKINKLINNFIFKEKGLG